MVILGFNYSTFFNLLQLIVSYIVYLPHIYIPGSLVLKALSPCPSQTGIFYVLRGVMAFSFTGRDPVTSFIHCVRFTFTNYVVSFGFLAV